MATKKNIFYQTISLNITSAGLTKATQSESLDKTYKRVKGIQVTVQDSAAAERGTFDIFRISSIDIYPKGFESKLITCGIDVPPNQRFDRNIDEEAAGVPVNITYVDGSTPGTTYPYLVNVIFELHNPAE